MIAAIPGNLIAAFIGEFLLLAAGHQVRGYSFVLETPMLVIIMLTFTLSIDRLFTLARPAARIASAFACAAFVVLIWIVCLDDRVRSTDLPRVALTASIFVLGNALAIGLYVLCTNSAPAKSRKPVMLLATIAAVLMSVAFVLVSPDSEAGGVHVSAVESALIRMNLAFPIAWLVCILSAFIYIRPWKILFNRADSTPRAPHKN